MRLVTLSDVGLTSELRIDPHHYVLRELVEPLRTGIAVGSELGGGGFEAVANGVNLPREAYESDPEQSTSTLSYASVSAISQFAFRPEEAITLRPAGEYDYGFDIEAASVQANEVIMTRSGSPGIAWPGSAIASEERTVIPSGFTIKITCDSSVYNSAYVAAVLNHPAWRVWTSSLAAGKRQRNISQEHLYQVRIPLLALEAQQEAAAAYGDALRDIREIIEAPSGVQNVCDSLIEQIVGVRVPTFAPRPLTSDIVQLSDVSASRVLRLDPRYYRADFAAISSQARSGDALPLRSFFTEPMLRGTQPSIPSVDEGNEPRVVSTIAIQDGQVVKDQTKPCAPEGFDDTDDRLLRANDLLFTLDGEVSRGKVAVFEGGFVAVADTHVAIMRIRPELVHGLACYLNSSFGRAQVEQFSSGATAMQIAREDVEDLRVPRLICDRLQPLGEAFRAAVQQYKSRTTRVRMRLCDASAELSEELLNSDTLTANARSFLAQRNDASALFKLLGTLRPSMF